MNRSFSTLRGRFNPLIQIEDSSTKKWRWSGNTMQEESPPVFRVATGVTN